MMNKLICLLMFLLFGCKERYIDLDLPYVGDRLVIFSQVRANDTIKVELEKTYSPTGQSTYADGIKNANVILLGGDGYNELLNHMSNGVYVSKSGRVWKENTKYRLDVNAPGFPRTTSNFETMPSKPIVESYEFGKDIDSKYNSGVPSKELIIKIRDTDRINENFYMIVIKRTIGKDTFGVNSFDLDKPSDFEDPCQFKYFSSIVISDICSIDGILTVKKGFEISYPFNLNVDKSARDKINVYVRQISKSYYEFCRTYYNEDDLTVAFKPPYPRYTNITGGYGIFAAYNEAEKEFVLVK